ncbi:MAG: alpha-2-macroglobulin family protein [Porphyromonas sp.]|nr:alpha-2-macroglobulin family protein [Porphyromonas sp.]
MRTIYTTFIALCVGLMSCPLEAQSDKLAQLERQLDQAIERGHPRTRDSLLTRYRSEVLATGRNKDYLRIMSRYRFYYSYEQAADFLQKADLSAEEQLFCQSQMLYFLAHLPSYRRPSGPIQTNYQELKTSDWTRATLEYAQTQLIEKLWADPRALAFSPRPYGHDWDTMAAYLGQMMEQVAGVENGRYDPPSSAMLRLIDRQLERYISIRGEASTELPILWTQVLVRYPFDVDRLPRLRALEQRWHLQPVARRYALDLIERLVRQDEYREAYDLAKAYQAQLSADPKQRKEYNELLSRISSIDYHVDKLSTGLWGQSQQRFAIRSRGVERMRVRIYQAPVSALPNLNSWSASKDGKLVYEQEFACSTSPSWAMVQDTISIPHPGNGVYRIELEPAKLQSYAKSPRHADGSKGGQGYILTGTYVLSESYSGKPRSIGGLRFLDAQTGAARAGLPLRVQHYVWENKQQVRRATERRADKQGWLALAKSDNDYIVQLLDPKDPVVYTYYGGREGWDSEQDSKQSIFITSDRGIYRPGQELQVYGYLAEQHRHPEQDRTLSGRTLRLSLTHNGEEFARDTLQTDAYGRFTTKLQLPVSMPLGDYRLEVKDLSRLKERYYYGSAIMVEVAEYKRPQVELQLEGPRAKLSLSDTLELKMNVRNYSGIALSGSKIQVHLSAQLDAFPDRKRPHSNRLLQEEERYYNLSTDASGQATLRIPLEELSRVETSLRDYGAGLWCRLRISAEAPSGETVEEHVAYSATNTPSQIKLVGPQTVARGSAPEMSKWHFASNELFVYNKRHYPLSYRIEHAGRTLQEGKAMTSDTIQPEAWIAKASSGAYALHYQVETESEPVVGTHHFVVYDVRDKQIELPEAGLQILAKDLGYRHGEAPQVLVATSLNASYVHYTVEYDNRDVLRGSLRPKSGEIVSLPIRMPADTIEQVFVHVYTVQEGKYYEARQTYERRREPKQLEFRWSSWRSRTLAGSQEQWTLQVLHEGKPIRAALASWMYDASLDALSPHEIDMLSPSAELFARRSAFYIESYWPDKADPWGRIDWRTRGIGASLNEGAEDDEGAEEIYEIPEPRIGAAPTAVRTMAFKSADEDLVVRGNAKSAPEAIAPTGKMPMSPRQNFQELAYIYPTMTTNERGEASWSFRMPDALTRWRVIALAHTEDLRTGFLSAEVESYRELQVEPYLPRFIRLGDSLSIATQIHNRGEQELRPMLRVSYLHPRTKAQLFTTESPLTLGAKASMAQRTSLPTALLEGLDSVLVQVQAGTELFSDGEEHLLPVLPATTEVLRAEAITLYGKTTGEYDLSRSLLPANGFRPERGQLQIRLESNPLYLALLAMPKLTEVSSQNAINYATAYYAMGLARQVAQTPGLSAWIEERSRALGTGLRVDRDKQLHTDFAHNPWRAQLAEERELKQLNALRSLMAKTQRSTAEEEWLTKLAELQLADGGFAWYRGMESSVYMTTSVLKNFLRRRQLTGENYSGRTLGLMNKAWNYMHREMSREIAEYKRDLARPDRKRYASVYNALDYLYLVYLDPSQATAAKANADFLRSYLRKGLAQMDHSSKAMAVLIYAESDPKLSASLLESLRQHLRSDEQGSYFPESVERSYWWYDRSIEAHLGMIEALGKQAKPRDKALIVGIKRWLLGQKRTTSWSNSLATAEVLHSLTLGLDLSADAAHNTASIKLSQADGKTTTIASTERQGLDLSWERGAEPKQLTIMQTKPDGELWASAIARYTLPLSEDTPSGRELKLRRRYHLRRIVDGAEQLIPLSEGQALRVGDILVTNLDIELDRRLDFVALSDPRLACAEPVSQLAGYSWGAGTPYYIEPRDQRTNFYFYRLTAGKYSFQYEQRIVRSGQYQSASAQLQSVYAPEYAATTGYTGTLRVEP